MVQIMKMVPLLFEGVLLCIFIMEGKSTKLKTIQANHEAKVSTSSSIQYLAGLSNVQYTNEVLDNILIPRVSGTEGNKKVFNYIKSELENLKWSIEVDSFEDNTPFGHKSFKNIIASLNPNAERFLVLACHFDSKFFDDITFVGATDSAVPCAMMLNMIKIMDNEFKKLSNDSPLSMKLIFFDGEEAFVNWGPDDSIYGAKHLAKVWAANKKLSKLTNEMVSDLQRIDVFVLLDIIGHKGTTFLSCFDNTEKWFVRLANIEDKLSRLNLLKNELHQYFVRRRFRGYIEDDHIPFLQKNVPILHLISVPFTDAWHTEKDNRDVIDMDTVEDINKILRVFVAEYLNIEIIEESENQKIPYEEL